MTLQKCVLDFANNNYETDVPGIWWILSPVSKRIWHTNFTLKIDTYYFKNDLVNADSMVIFSCSDTIQCLLQTVIIYLIFFNILKEEKCLRKSTVLPFLSCFYNCILLTTFHMTTPTTLLQQFIAWSKPWCHRKIYWEKNKKNVTLVHQLIGFEHALIQHLFILSFIYYSLGLYFRNR